MEIRRTGTISWVVKNIFMGKLIKTTTPLFFQSKLLCVSLLYLFTALFLFLYTSLSRNKCLFRSSPFDPIQKPLFSYPSSYGEHKYAIPTHRSSCSSPVYFSDYWMVLKEIQDLCNNSSTSLDNLNYLKGKGETFGGNLSAQERFSYFDHSNDTVQVPCGFFKEFPISDFDRGEMENCRGLVVATAIFNDHDKIRQPMGLGSKTIEHACFFMFIDETTLNSLYHHNLIPKNSPGLKIGAWRIVKIPNQKKSYENPAMNGIIPKYLIHRIFPNSKFSVWTDAKIQLTVDPFLLIHSLVVDPNVDMAVSKHPFFVHTAEEAMATARWKKWEDVEGLRRQMEIYCEFGLKPWSPHKLPYPTDVPDSAVILRRHGLGSNLFSCLVFNELEAFNPRDQLAFAYVRDQMKPKVRMNMFEVEVFEQIAVEYRHNLKRFGNEIEKQESGSRAKTNLAKPLKNWSLDNSSCHSYLVEMWG